MRKKKQWKDPLVGIHKEIDQGYRRVVEKSPELKKFDTLIKSMCPGNRKKMKQAKQP